MKLLEIFYQKVLPILIIIGIPLLQSCRSDSTSFQVKIYNYDGKLIKETTCDGWREYDNGVSLEIGDNKTYISLPVIIEGQWIE